MPHGYEIFRFSQREFDFVGEMKRLIVGNMATVIQLDEIHHRLPEQYDKPFEVGSDSATFFHRLFYDKYRSGWPEMTNLYERFIEKVISARFDEDFLYQSFPTVRFHLPLNLAVGAYHTDSEFYHPEGEINYIIPLTNSTGTASCWVESEEGKNDFEPMKMCPGELIIFNGSKLRHGSEVNKTGTTRVSMDFRVLPVSKYNPDNEDGSITLGTKFREGAYYKRYKFMQILNENTILEMH